MAVEGIGNLVQNLADRAFQQGQVAPPVARVVGAQNIGTGAASEDTFTPSTQTNSGVDTQDAGIFEVNQGARSVATADVLPAPVPPDAGQTVPTQPTDSIAGANASLKVNAQQASPTGGPGTTSGQSVSGPAETAEAQLAIQRLNASLPALGLTNNEIQEIDRIAALIKNFNPAAYSNLVNQFEARSQEAEQRAQSAPQGSSSPPRPGPIIGGGSRANDGGFQVPATLLPPQNSDGRVEATAATGSENTAGNPVVFSAPGLQIQQVEVGSSGGNGSAREVQAAQQPSSSGTENP